jgi:hypothetical protein
MILGTSPFTNFGRRHQGLNPLTSLVETCGLAEAVSLPMGTQLASFLREIEIDRHPVFDSYARPIQEKLRSLDPEERVHGLRQFQLALQIVGPDASAAAALELSLHDPKRTDLRRSFAAHTRLARRELASQEPGALIPRDTGFEGRVRSLLASAPYSDENIGKLRLWCLVSQDLHAARRLYEFRRTHMDWQAGYTDLTAVVRTPRDPLGWYFLSQLTDPCADKYDFTRLRPEVYTMIRLTEERPPLRALLLDAIVMYSLHCRDEIPFLVLSQGALLAAGAQKPERIERD